MISVIIPCFNHEKDLLMSLHTLALQTVAAELEVIIVDDGSEKPLHADIITAAYPYPFQLIRQENRGAPAARNAGFRASHGEYVIFWDADIIAKRYMLGLMKAVLEQHKEAGFVYGDHLLRFVQMKGQPYSLESLQKGNYIHSSSLVRREAVIPWDESLKRFQDWDFWLTLGEKGVKGIHIPAVLYKVRETGKISYWLPRIAYQKPWRFLPWWKKRVEQVEVAKAVITAKHHL